MIKSSSNIFEALMLNGFTSLLGGLCLFFFTPLYKYLGGYEVVGLVGFYIAVTIFAQFMDGGYSVTATKVMAQTRSLKLFESIEKDFFWALAMSFSVLLVCQLLAGLLNTRFALPIFSLYQAILVHLLFYFYSQVSLGLSLHRTYSSIFLIYNIGRHFLLVLAIVIGFRFEQSFFLLTIFFLPIFFLFRKKLTGDLRSHAFDEADVSFNTKKYAFGIMLGAIVGGILASADRILAAEIFDPQKAGIYFSSFVLASVLALVPIPIYRVFFPRFSATSKADRSGLQRELTAACDFTILPTGLLALVLICFCDSILSVWLGESTPMQSDIAFVLICAYVCIAIGWMPAALLQSQGLQFIQTTAMLIAVLIGLCIILVLHEMIGILIMTSILVVHGVVQAVFIPLAAIRVLNLPMTLEVFRTLYFAPALVVGFIVARTVFESHLPDIGVLVMFFVPIAALLVRRCKATLSI
jgi:O-antigen/teichoic acid export membrane protein